MAPRDLIVQKVRADIRNATDGLPDDHLPPGHLVCDCQRKPVKLSHSDSVSTRTSNLP
jgi:hypothetical protein